MSNPQDEREAQIEADAVQWFEDNHAFVSSDRADWLDAQPAQPDDDGLLRDIYQQLRFAWTDHNARNTGARNIGLEAVLNKVADLLKDGGSPWWRKQVTSEGTAKPAPERVALTPLTDGQVDALLDEWAEAAGAHWQEDVLRTDGFVLKADLRQLVRAAHRITAPAGGGEGSA